MDFSEIVAFLTHEDRLPTMVAASAPAGYILYLLLRKVFTFAVRRGMSRDEMRIISMAAMNGAEREVDPEATVPKMAERAQVSLRSFTEHDATVHVLEDLGERVRNTPEVKALGDMGDELAWKAERVVRGHDSTSRQDAPPRGRRPGTRIKKGG